MRYILTLLLLTLSLRADDYLILSVNSASYATNVSAMIWQLTAPESKTNANVTKFWCGFIQHQDGRVAIQIPDNDALRISLNADADYMPNLLSASGIITAQEATVMKNTINANRGNSVSVRAHFPLSKLGNQRTRAQMESDGWFTQ